MFSLASLVSSQRLSQYNHQLKHIHPTVCVFTLPQPFLFSTNPQPLLQQLLLLPPLSYPNTELAAASTDVREFRVVVMPALAMEMVCCSMASWIATRSVSRIWQKYSRDMPLLQGGCLSYLVKFVNADYPAIG